jgi:hypothetical protein
MLQKSAWQRLACPLYRLFQFNSELGIHIALKQLFHQEMQQKKLETVAPNSTSFVCLP